jgi:hypothetical protein
VFTTGTGTDVPVPVLWSRNLRLPVPVVRNGVNRTYYAVKIPVRLYKKDYEFVPITLGPIQYTKKIIFACPNVLLFQIW